MKYIQFFFASTLVAGLIYYVLILMLIDSPIPAEYWVGEMITIKKELVRGYSGKNKIIIAGGSSTLFGFDAEYASKQLNMPVINFGLHAGLKLEKILQEVSLVVEPGDILVLPLEPPYYECHEKLTTWQVENMIGWDHDEWKKMGYAEKAEFITMVSPGTFAKMIVADMQRRFDSARINDRLISLNNSFVLSKFRTRARPFTFEYSAYHLNNHGDMLQTDGAKYYKSGYDINRPDHVCNRTVIQLVDFIENMNKQRVAIFFANSPYIKSGVSQDDIRSSEIRFQKKFISVGCFIDKREDLILDRKYFFDTNLHLNAEGRIIRTDLFIDSIRKNVFSGVCKFRETRENKSRKRGEIDTVIN